MARYFRIILFALLASTAIAQVKTPPAAPPPTLQSRLSAAEWTAFTMQNRALAQAAASTNPKLRAAARAQLAKIHQQFAAVAAKRKAVK